MGTLTLTWPQVALLVFLVLAVYAAEMIFFHWRLRRYHFAERLAAARLQNLEKAVEELRSALIEAAGRSAPGRAAPAPEPADAPERVRFAVSYPSPPAPAEPQWIGAAEEGGTPYSQAIELARRGADAARLTRECGLSRGEADLIVSLYGRSARK